MQEGKHRHRGAWTRGSHITEAQHRVPNQPAQLVAGLSSPHTRGLLEAVSRMCPNSQGGHGVLAES